MSNETSKPTTVTRTVETRRAGVKATHGQPLPPADATQTVTTDFSGCTYEQILELAERTVVIKYQGQLRKANDDPRWTAAEVTLNAAELMFTKAPRGEVDPKATLDRLEAKLGKEAFRTLLESMGHGKNRRA